MDFLTRRDFVKGAALSASMLSLPAYGYAVAPGETVARPGLPPVRFRQIHLDFHTSPLVPDVGAQFNGDEFAAVLKGAHVDSINIFAKCHWGMSYYPTKVGVMHPSLKQDMLGGMIEGCRKQDIHTMIYLCGMWDMRVAEQQAEYRVLNADGTLPRGGPFIADWITLCLNTPYMDYVAAQTEELAERYESTGFWFDLVDYPHDGCSCPYCMRERTALGMDSSDVNVRRQHTVMVYQRAMDRLTTIVRKHRPNALIFYNGKLRVGMGMRKDLTYETHLEIESLPGALWGYAHFEVMGRYLRNLGVDYVGITGKFHRSWGGFGEVRNQSALDYECSRILAQAGKCSIGDQMHPRGRLSAPVYERIGNSYKSVAEKEPWCTGAKAVTDIGYVSTAHMTYANYVTEEDLGVTKMLEQLHQQFDCLDWDADFTRYKVLVLADRHRLDDVQRAKVEHYLAGGGKVIVSHESGMNTAGTEFILTGMGVRYLRPSEYPGDKGDYMEALGDFGQGIPAMPNFTFASGLWVEPEPGTTVHARFWKPYFDRTYQHFCSHAQNPEDGPTPYPAVTEKGSVMYVAFPIFTSYARNGYAVQKRTIANCLARLMPEAAVRTNAPSSAQVTVTEQETRQGKRRMVHLLYYAAERRTPDLDIVEDTIPLHDVRIALRSEAAPGNVYLAPQQVNLPVTYQEGYATVTVPEVHGHQMVVFEA